MYSAGLLALAAGAVLAANNATSEALKAGCGVDFEPPPEAMSIFQELSTSANASLEARADAFEPVTVNVNLHVVTGVESEQKDYPVCPRCPPLHSGRGHGRDCSSDLAHIGTTIE